MKIANFTIGEGVAQTLCVMGFAFAIYVLIRLVAKKDLLKPIDSLFNTKTSTAGSVKVG